ncbi:hypothetical protein CC1G_07927 [Coprinopsis cinerea okayama7|uniref:GST N-terminal domain-containing protein n=1 Tax=Coprinopsis cinerea (strain Okayama-7 / 130 / ATCC MYA-4618 / FGSC 9003) TaxID=240176 RepID=A8P6R7_COPC7|nr:hypothetical protein CC1G_07927 [Coprinopsis cinerea okayama7\|eukprot:XP_001839212.1 hypothetical protein CC1G_07927 [Coprinopsis cinerea okayama7\
MITLYDSRLTHLQAANPTTWKARFVLNYKNLPYKTEWTPYHDIASVYHKHNLQPVCSRTDPSTGKEEPYYTIPVIFDDSTGKAIADSLEIAKYLDETYPDTPKVVPETGEDGVDAKQQVDTFMGVMYGALGPLVLPVFQQSYQHVEEESKPFFAEARTKDFGAWFGNPKSLLDLLPLKKEDEDKGWEAAEKTFAGLDARVPGRGKEVGWYLGGESPTFVDFVLGGFLIYLKSIYGEESEGWKRIVGWNEGKWGAFLDKLSAYQAVH